MTEEQTAVIGVAPFAFYNCRGATEVVLPQTMLYYATQGQTFVIPDGIEEIGEGAFTFSFLGEVVIPSEPSAQREAVEGWQSGHQRWLGVGQKTIFARRQAKDVEGSACRRYIAAV